MYCSDYTLWGQTTGVQVLNPLINRSESSVMGISSSLWMESPLEDAVSNGDVIGISLGHVKENAEKEQYIFSKTQILWVAQFTLPNV
jgi:hypothetical protein